MENTEQGWPSPWYHRCILVFRQQRLLVLLLLGSLVLTTGLMPTFWPLTLRQPSPAINTPSMHEHHTLHLPERPNTTHDVIAHNQTSALPPVTHPDWGEYRVCISPVGRLGNTLFQFASVYGIAMSNHRTPCLHKGFASLKDIFPNLEAKFVKSLPPKLPVLHEQAYATYSPKLMTDLPSRDVRVATYLQSWKYFDKYSESIRWQLQIAPSSVRTMTTYLSDVSDRWRSRRAELGRAVGAGDVTFVGIHIRRGDMLSAHSSKKGYQVAPVGYILKAMDYFRGKYSNPLFLIATDGRSWSNENLRDLNKTFDDVQYESRARTELEDFTLLTLCNHTILTVGSFGWWGAYLGASYHGGEVIYYNHPIAAHSSLARGFNPEDFFPPTWKPIGGDS